MHASKEFKVYNPRACSKSLQASLAKDPTASVNRVTWHYDGKSFGVAYSKNIVHQYFFTGIEAHDGYVSDLAFSHPNKSWIITCGEDKAVKVKGKLEGHLDRVTGLAFSIHLNALVSSGADGQIFVWNMDGWKKQANGVVHFPDGRAPSPRMQNHVQFHQDQTHLLVFNENLIAVYEAPEVTCIEKWFSGNISGYVTCATYSCDSRSIYVGFASGNIIVFSAALSPLCLIKAYLTTSPRILDKPTEELQHSFDTEHPNIIKESLVYDTSLLEFCSYQALNTMTTRPDYLADKKFRSLTFDMMLAWERPSAA